MGRCPLSGAPRRRFLAIAARAAAGPCRLAGPGLMARAPFEFSVIPGNTVREIIQADLPGIVHLVAGAYRAHARNQTVNPPSQFLRFPDRPNARIISLPAHL